jgi:hypothetical protein
MKGTGICIVALLAYGFFTAGVLSAQDSVAETTAMKSVATIREIMFAITIPTSESVFKAASEPPDTPAGWTQVRDQALALAESANLLIMPGRAPDTNEWTQFAVVQREAAVVAMKAAESRDAEALSNASDALYDTCANCHARYLDNR